ncbi:MAG: DUF748 domain-containing protein [Nitrospirae bacterium]|nr:DUF748 domain-containing protein [Nitrospirota bacterium]
MKKVLIALVFLVILLIPLLYLYIKLPELARTKIEGALGRGFTIGKVRLAFASLEVSDIKYMPDDAKAETINIKSIRLYPRLSELLKKRIAIGRVDVESPKIYLVRFRDGRFNLPAFKSTGEEKPGMEVALKTIVINGGSLDFLDEKAGRIPFKLSLYDMKVSLGHLDEKEISFTIDSSIKGKTPGSGKIKGKGSKEKLSADVIINNFDLTLIMPYLKSGDVKPKAGSISMNSEVKYAAGFVNAPVDAKIKNLQLETSQGIKRQFLGASTQAITELIKKKGEIHLKFRVYGPPKDLKNDIKEAMQREIAESLGRTLIAPGKEIEKTGKGIGKAVEDIGKELSRPFK